MNKNEIPVVEDGIDVDEPFKVEELFLLHLRYKAALYEQLGNNTPILLNAPDNCWVVYAGWVDIFAIPLREGQLDGVRKHLFRVKAGQAIFGMGLSENGNGFGLIAVGSNNASMLKVSLNMLYKLSEDEEMKSHVASLFDGWVKALSSTLNSILPPKNSILLEASDIYELKGNEIASSKKGVLWVRHKIGKSYFMGDESLPALNGKLHYPISDRTWLQASESIQLESEKTLNLLQTDHKLLNLQPFHQLFLKQLRIWDSKTKLEDQKRLFRKVSSNQDVVEDAIAGLARQFVNPEEVHFSGEILQNPLLTVCKQVGQELKIEIKEPPSQRVGNLYDPLTEIARASRIQTRRVALKGDWWGKNNGPLVAWIDGESKQPVALIPKNEKGYILFHPNQPLPQQVDEALAATLEPFAYMFYKPFPEEKISLMSLLKFGVQNIGFDVRNMLVFGFGISLMGLLIPIATGLIVNSIIPNGDISQIIQIGIILFVASFASVSFGIAQNLAMLRIQGTVGSTIQSAMWNRLLNLPVSFFRQYTAGDLGNRVMGVSAIEQTLSGPVITSLLVGLFSISSLVLLFYYDVLLAIVALLLVGVAVVASITAGRAQVHYQRILTKLQGQLSGLVLQTITGVSKIRSAGVEGHAFATWAKEFSKYKQTTYVARNVQNNLVAFYAAYVIVMSMVIFAVVTYSDNISLTTGSFLAFNVAFIQFFTAVLTLTQAYVAILNIVPIYERAKPILQTLPEVDSFKIDPDELTGEIEISQVSFRYKADAPLVLENISLKVNPGEFVALVGSSGSGKSTLFRLLLGFDVPEAGAIYYSGLDLSKIDIREVRRQLGVVLQDGKLMAGDIFTNIIGSSLLTIEDAWRAADMAGLKSDIKAMPMGMHTVISEGGGTLSGGQRQRLLIARAMVNKPRILYFDEATSALDNRTQAIVGESLDSLQSTRIVIAHRLSTIMHADKIYVLDRGRIVQQGTYSELLNEDGVFAELAKRQLT